MNAQVYTLKRLNKVETEVKRLATQERGFSRKAIIKTLADDAFAVDHHDYYLLAPEIGDTDDLSTITNGADGRKIILSPYQVDQTLTVKAGVGNIQMAADVVLDAPNKTLQLVYNKTLDAWVAVGGVSTGGGVEEHSHPP